MPLVQIYTCRDGMEAHLLQGLLAEQGISAVVLGETLANAAGALPFVSAAFPTVWVNDFDEGRAREFVETFDKSRTQGMPPSGATDWACPNCGERIEGQFTDCWKCQTPRPATAAAQHEAIDAPDDRALQCDLSCVRCAYNLRGLTARHRCPECGVPVLKTLLDLTSAGMLSDRLHVQQLLSEPFESASASAGYPSAALALVCHAWLRAVHPIDESEEDTKPARLAARACAAMRDLAIDQFGDPDHARAQLRAWGIRGIQDVGSIVRALMSAGVIYSTHRAAADAMDASSGSDPVENPWP